MTQDEIKIREVEDKLDGKGLFVEITIRREDGTVVMKMAGDAFGVLRWSAPSPDAVIVQGYRVLNEFTYFPR